MPVCSARASRDGTPFRTFGDRVQGTDVPITDVQSTGPRASGLPFPPTGHAQDQVAVRSGYARNYLIPQGKAKFATAENIAEFEARRAELEAQATAALEEALQRKEKLDGVKITIAAKESSEGKLFGSVGNVDVIEALRALGHKVEKREVRMPDGRAFDHL